MSRCSTSKTATMIRTLKFALRRDPASSQAIRRCATKRNADYKHAVEVLNREPSLPKRSAHGYTDATSKHITA